MFNFSIHDLGRHRVAVAVVAAATTTTVVLPTVYVAYLNWAVRRRTTCSSGQLSPPPADQASASSVPPRTPRSLPDEVMANPEEWVVSYERVVSRPIPAAMLVHKLRGGGDDHDKQTTAGSSPSPLLTTYLRTTYKAFGWTPQAFLIRGLLAEPERRASFGAAHIDGLAFADGDVVDGVYKVTSYQYRQSSSSSSSKGGSSSSAEVIELSIDVPRSYKGPAVRGLILSAVEEEEGEVEGPPVSAMPPPTTTTTAVAVRFVNETWLWRKRDEKPTMLESGLGRWFHSLLAGWLVMKGLGGVVRR
ncbi:hypothetical protein IF1G_08774 [Cordyceps javanica]|uniref:Uncharacterized protein n=1 Tax=Cordyceps javanica TaxID=43265 RepID=A0A545UTS9_9HYPO|nr:hypothetical protein IF1G_08774 [Cordyceps javanica]TQW02164.1 hypothetical protein IF2G_10369 [Cordyceps javanica]